MLVHMCMLVIHMLVMLTAVVSDVGNQLTLLGDQRRLLCSVDRHKISITPADKCIVCSHRHVPEPWGSSGALKAEERTGFNIILN